MSREEPDTLQAIARDVARITAENARLLDRLAQGEKRFRLISQGVLRIQEAERGRISRELHDGVGQSLTALKMQLELLERSLPRAGGSCGRASPSSRGSRTTRYRTSASCPACSAPRCSTSWASSPPCGGWRAPFTKGPASVSSSPSRGSRSGPDPDLETIVYRAGAGGADQRRQARRGRRPRRSACGAAAAGCC